MGMNTLLKGTKLGYQNTENKDALNNKKKVIGKKSVLGDRSVL